MRTRNIILYFVGILFFCSCEDMFEPAKENNRQEAAMYEESAYAHGLLMYGYDRLPYTTNVESVTSDVATDDAVTNQKNNTYLLLASGTWRSDNNPLSMWDGCKDAIQYINKFLTIVDDVKWALSAESKNQMYKDRLKGEALGLRAMHYYFLLQAHAGYADDGQLYGVPMLTTPEDASSDFNQPRALFSDCIKQMFEDCDQAIELLPYDYADIKVGEESKIPAKYLALGAQIGGYNLVLGNNSRLLMSGRIAEAIKAQIALLAASPAFRDQSGVTSEQAANIIAKALKNNNGLDGFDKSGNVWYKNKTMLEPSAAEMPEIVWREVRHSNNSQEKSNFPPSLYGNGNINPSQNLVDVFPMINGYPINNSNSGYDAKNPYLNRDPRLDNTVIYNGMTFKKTLIITGTYPNETVQPAISDDNLNSLSTSTRTGYYLKKLLRDDVSVAPSGAISQQHVYARIRYTEIFLAYAEAANDAWGPKNDGGNGFSAYDVIKAIRQRAGIGTYSDEIGTPSYDHGDPYLEECASDKNKMAELIRNERRIELCFENKRFWDLRRWKMPLNETVMGVKVDRNPDTEELTYTPIVVDERKYDESYQWYGPLPKGEVLKWSNLKQNKGWN